MSEEWDDTFEPEGLTLGPEERLEREVARSKALKVERLQLRDRISRLEEENARLKKQLENSHAVPPTLAEQLEIKPNGNPGLVRVGLIFLILVTSIFCLRWLAG